MLKGKLTKDLYPYVIALGVVLGIFIVAKIKK